MSTPKFWHMRNAALALAMGLLAIPALTLAAGSNGTTTGPTVESALAADQALAKAIRDNDAQGIVDMLDDDWIVVATTGGMGVGKTVFPDGIRSGGLVRKTFELIDPRVRLYGNVAVVTSKIKTSGVLQGKPFDVLERQTDVLVWKDGAWKCVLTHETKMETPAKSRAKAS